MFRVLFLIIIYGFKPTFKKQVKIIKNYSTKTPYFLFLYFSIFLFW